MRPASYSGDVIFEGELGVVISQRCYQVSELAAADFVFGYTCVNDVTAIDWLRADASFPQWTRAKGAPTFGAIGPSVATSLDLEQARVVVTVGGEKRQDYAVSDMIFSPLQIVSAISQDIELHPGDVIACGTSVGTGPIPGGAEVQIEIDGIGVLSNRFESA